MAMVPTLGLLGAVLGHRLRLPAGVFVGAMAGVGAAPGILGFPEVSPSPLWSGC